MTSLFSVFDPQAVFGLSLNWMVFFAVTVLMPALYWPSYPQPTMGVKSLMSSLMGEFKPLMGHSAWPGFAIWFTSVLTLVALANFMGLVPYVFTPTSHLAISLSLALPMWLGHVAYGWAKSTENMLAHLVPSGSPLALSAFMVIIELVSNIIRPLTLSVRLAANMVAGHLLLVLVSSSAVSGTMPLVLGAMVGLIALSVLETAVALIQSYVFSVLSILYVQDVASGGVA